MMKRLLHALPLLLLAPTFGCSGAADDEPLIIQLGDGVSDAGDDTTSDAAIADVETEADMGMAPDVGPEDTTPDLPPEPTGTTCQMKDAPIQLINTCMFEWSSCDGGVEYGFRCDIQNVAGNVFSLCNCFQNGVKDEADKIVDICGLGDWGEVEAIVNEQCGWDLR